MGVAGLGVGAVLGALPAPRRGRGGPSGGARNPRRASPPCWWRAGGRGVAGQSGGRGPMRVRGTSWGRGGRSRGLGGGAASPAGTGFGAGGLASLRAAWSCSAGGLTGTAAPASCRSSRSAGVFPAHPGDTGERERDWQWWRSSR